ncbi:MAG: TolC family protein [Nitrospiraceae bacterium]|nr:TolC family protein [Nitrospiraceae bacterium]
MHAHKGMKSVWLVAVVALGFALGLCGTGWAETPKAHVYTLDACIQKALEFSPEVAEAKQDVAVYAAKKDQADGAAYPEISMLALTGPSPEARKTDISPFIKTDVSTKINGIFGIADITLIQPIYTFGKISSYKLAAESGKKAAEAGAVKKASDIILRTKELYFGLVLAKDLKKLALEIKDELEKSARRAQRQVDTGSPYADEVQLFKFQTYLSEVNRNLNEIEKNMAFASDALATSMGLPRGTVIDPADTTIALEERKPGTVAELMTYASLYRAEITQLNEGLKARQALVDAEKSSQYPMIFAGLQGVVSGATNRDRIRNPYINDYFFSSNYAALFLGLKWGFDFGITKGRIKEAEAEYNKLVEKKRFADEAIPLQVRKAYLDYSEATKSIADTDRAVVDARKWLVSTVANYDVGIGDAKDIGDAAQAYAMTKMNNLKSRYNQRMSYANILYATGLDQQGR